MHPWNFVFGHVTGDAIVGAYSADLREVAGLVTTQTSVIVRGQVAHPRLMRIVTGKASNAVVAPEPTLASFQAIGLEAKITNSERLAQNHVHVSAVTCSAEIYLINRIELAGIQNCL
jgi:hypothetical protein